MSGKDDGGNDGDDGIIREKMALSIFRVCNNVPWRGCHFVMHAFQGIHRGECYTQKLWH